MAPTIEKVTEGCTLGEGPHWDVDSQTLYFVDIFGQNILRYTPATKKFAKASVGGKSVSFIVPVAGRKNQFVVSLDKEVTIISWDRESDNVTTVETLWTANQSPKNILNDAKCDSSGRLWAGVHEVDDADFTKSRPLGALFSIDSKRQAKRLVDQIQIANGLAFNNQAKKFYYIDSLKGTVDQFDFNITEGTVANRQVLFTLKKHNIPGIPDGMTIDTDGNLWVAVFGGGRVLKIDAKKAENLLETIELPAIQVTSMAFGGPNLDELYVTTGALPLGGEKLGPLVNGATYKISNTGSKGFPGVSFKLN